MADTNTTILSMIKDDEFIRQHVPNIIFSLLENNSSDEEILNRIFSNRKLYPNDIHALLLVLTAWSRVSLLRHVFETFGYGFHEHQYDDSYDSLMEYAFDEETLTFLIESNKYDMISDVQRAARRLAELGKSTLVNLLLAKFGGSSTLLYYACIGYLSGKHYDLFLSLFKEYISITTASLTAEQKRLVQTALVLATQEKNYTLIDTLYDMGCATAEDIIQAAHANSYPTPPKIDSDILQYALKLSRKEMSVHA